MNLHVHWKLLHSCLECRQLGYNRFGEQEPKWRDVWVVQLYKKKDMGPGYVQLTVVPASQPPERIMEAKRLKKLVQEIVFSLTPGFFGFSGVAS